MLGYAEHALTAAGYAVDKASLAVSKDHAGFFGTLTLRTPVAHGLNVAVGLHNSTDKSQV